MKRHNKPILALLVLTMSLLALTACGSSPQNEASDPPPQENAAPAPTNVGTFTMTDLDGNEVTQELFAQHKLTMVNLFATWCNPCVNEIPELEKLQQNMADQGFGVVGIVLDGMAANGDPDPDVIETAKVLAERTGATYPFIVPDLSGMNGRLYNVTAVPETFFVDSEGNYVGNIYMGARNLEQWTEIAETELRALQEEQ